MIERMLLTAALVTLTGTPFCQPGADRTTTCDGRR